MTSWIPALDGVDGKLRAGAKVADIGCGFGASTVLLAREYPNSAFTGSDYHDRSIEIARKRAADAGVAGRVSFEVATASEFSGTGYDLAATFDCLHDMGDPLGAARHVRQALAPDGTWLIVEPYAGLPQSHSVARQRLVIGHASIGISHRRQPNQVRRYVILRQTSDLSGAGQKTGWWAAEGCLGGYRRGDREDQGLDILPRLKAGDSSYYADGSSS